MDAFPRKSPETVRQTTPEPTRRNTPEPIRRNTPEPIRRNTPEPIRRNTPELTRRSSPEPGQSTPETARNNLSDKDGKVADTNRPGEFAAPSGFPIRRRDKKENMTPNMNDHVRFVYSLKRLKIIVFIFIISSLTSNYKGRVF